MKKMILLLSVLLIQIQAGENTSGSNTESPKIPRIGVFHLSNNLDMKTTMKNLFFAARDQKVDGIILTVDHHGGESASYSALHDLIKISRLKKPIIALVIGNSLSAGYRVTSAADYIIASTASDIGSIGTYFEVHKHSNVKINKDIKADKTIEVISQGKYKTICHENTDPLNEEMRDYLQKYLHSRYTQFIETIATNRKLSLEKQDIWAEARKFIASDALKVGLIDQIGTLFDVEEKMIELLKLRKPDINWAQQVDFVEFDTELPKK